jgi:hypothetical protein
MRRFIHSSGERPEKQGLLGSRMAIKTLKSPRRGFGFFDKNKQERFNRLIGAATIAPQAF